MTLHLIYKSKSVFEVLKGCSVPGKPAQLASNGPTATLFFPFSRVHVLHPLKLCFPCGKLFKSQDGEGKLSEPVGTRLPLPTTSLCVVNLRGRCFASTLKTFLPHCFSVAVVWSNVDDSYSPCCCLSRVKSGLSWGFSAGRTLCPRLWTCSRFPLGRVEGLWVYETRCPSCCFKMKV